MRIIGETEKEDIKITVFQMNGKISVKLEKNLLEQTYKFRDGSGIDSLEAVMNLVDDAFIHATQQTFIIMQMTRTSGLEKILKATSEGFEEII